MDHMVVNYVHTSYFHEELVIIFIYLILQRHIISVLILEGRSLIQLLSSARDYSEKDEIYYNH